MRGFQLITELGGVTLALAKDGVELDLTSVPTKKHSGLAVIEVNHQPKQPAPGRLFQMR